MAPANLAGSRGSAMLPWPSCATMASSWSSTPATWPASLIWSAVLVEPSGPIVEKTPLFGLLFLYNNLHVLHHRVPALPWYMLPRSYEKHRDFLVRLNGGLVYRGYFDVARRFLFRQHDRPTHPRHS